MLANLVHIALIGIVATILLVVIREQRSEWGAVLRIAVGVVMFLAVIRPLARLVADLVHLASLAHIPGAYIGLLLKVIGIAYLTTFAAHIAYDAGEVGTGWRIEVSGKIVILLLAMPLVASIAETVIKMIPS